jgi:hypothetical protein
MKVFQKAISIKIFTTIGYALVSVIIQYQVAPASKCKFFRQMLQAIKESIA